jgi:hypothetical protein
MFSELSEVYLIRPRPLLLIFPVPSLAIASISMPMHNLLVVAPVPPTSTTLPLARLHTM